ncbi:hypothetical protein [Candidatus Nanohalococcus occultus]|uniref:Membrane protein n=1 Tax=Candidatus Nanohalococcus occultus TaxID=2978047 RepID=A0ABY8CE28_9ARCH|nr:putative membrane protein [Candidatus Nanohaloarchaeota archaeon SVXNc]
MNRELIRTYINHFLPRDVVGPVIIVFSLEGVISGLFELYVPQEYATLSWLGIFFASVWLVAKWGTTGEAEEKLERKIEHISE